MNEIKVKSNRIALIEGAVNFKQGLKNRWEKTFVSIYQDLLCVYTDHTKEIELHHFSPTASWLSASSKSQNGLFVLNCVNVPILYLFEIGSDNLLRNWLEILNSAGWKSAIISSNVYPRSSHSESRLQNDTSLNNTNALSQSVSFTQSQPFDEKLDIQFSMKRRSSSLPALDSLLDELSNYSHENRPQSLIPLNQEPTQFPNLQLNVSESGYCSKESLNVDDRLVTMSKQISRQEQAHSDLGEVSVNEKKSIPIADKESNGAIKRTSNLNSPTKVDDENSLQTTLQEEITNSDQFELIDDPDATPKLEKRASMSQIILNFKSKFGSTATRKKGKKANKRLARHDVFSSRLLWNSNGQWKDRWFLCEDGTLEGYKDVGFKPADIVIDVKTCTLKPYNNDDMTKRLNLFKLTTPTNVVHIFAAWTEEQYEAWIEVLTYYAARREDTDDKETNEDTTVSDIEDSSIIPYEREKSSEQRKTTSSSSENSTGVPNGNRVDSIDSGNDGDESGLESSVNSFETHKMLENDREMVCRTLTNETMREENHSNNCSGVSPSSRRMNQLRIDFPRQESVDSTTSTEHDFNKSINSPSLEKATTPDENLIDFKKGKRSSYKQKFSSMFNGDKPQNKNDEHPTLYRTKSKSAGKEPITKKADINDKASLVSRNRYNDQDIKQEYISGIPEDNTRFMLRPPSLDCSVRLRESSVVTTEDQWDAVFGDQSKFKKVSLGSDDEHSECGSVPSAGSTAVSEEPKQDALEDALREETLLRKRRNSLTLRRGEILIKLDTLKDFNKKQQKQENSVEILDKKDKIDKLERRLETIDSQMKIIDNRIDLRINPTYKKKIKSINGKKTNSNNLITKLKKSKQKSTIENQIHSKSVESLISSESQGSSMTPSPGINRKATEKRLLNHTFSNSSELSVTSQSTRSSEDLTSGIQELLLATQKLGNSKLVQRPPLNSVLSASVRSKSVGCIELIDGPEKDIKDINQNHTAKQSQLIIEDFEKFSAMLTNQMKKSEMYHEPIDV